MNYEELRLSGVPICRGVAIGKPFFFEAVEAEIPEFALKPQEIESEIIRYYEALQRSAEEINKLHIYLEEQQMLESASILAAHLQLHKDPVLTIEVETGIRKLKKNAEFVFQKVIFDYQKKFSSLSNSFFREKFKDVQDVYRRVLNHLCRSVRPNLSDIPADSIVFARELNACDIAEANSACIEAFVTESGGPTSHAAIVAKAKGIPFVTSINFNLLEGKTNGLVIVDGRTGDVFMNPSAKISQHYQKLQKQLLSHLHKLTQLGSLKAETYDGYPMLLSANIDMINELHMVHQYGGHGVGLFRSEHIFLPNRMFPTEDEQFHIYKRLVKRLNGLPIVIRTFDVGGDKCMETHPQTQELNPYLGCRAIRLMLKEPHIFRTQIRAILRASIYGNVSIMFPMISALQELLEAKRMVYEVKQELEDSGVIPEIKKLRVGCMIEVPSAALIADHLAKECDFLSIGTNDLVQYTLAVDRGNHLMSDLYTPTHPSIIRLIKLIVNEANLRGIPVAICGEIASDPRFTPLLLGLGVHELSVASRYIPLVKNAIRNASIVEASQLAEKVLTLNDAGDILDLLTKKYRQNVPDDCFYNY